MTLTREQLLADLYEAYFEARKHKQKKPYQQRFEQHLAENLESLCNELYTRTYKPHPSSCFVIEEPKKREVFAAEFRDRIVHHLYYNYTHLLFERTFVQDTYSCIKGRGTHYGIRRLEDHIRKESQNYTHECYAMKMDIRGYFMHINRPKLLELSLRSLRKMATHKVSKHRQERWLDLLDMDFVEYLTREIVLLNPINDCYIVGSKDNWHDLPHDKSLYNSPKGCGLPIGNLTSQLFSNVYLNELDQFMKRKLKCRHYGRYVDDFYVISCDKQWLKNIVEKIKTFLLQKLGLRFHDGKLKITSIYHGIEFLGAWIKPHRNYANRETMCRITTKLDILLCNTCIQWFASVNSFCGILSHGRNFSLRRCLFICRKKFICLGIFNLLFEKYKTNYSFAKLCQVKN